MELDKRIRPVGLARLSQDQLAWLGIKARLVTVPFLISSTAHTFIVVYPEALSNLQDPHGASMPLQGQSPSVLGAGLGFGLG